MRSGFVEMEFEEGCKDEEDGEGVRSQNCERVEGHEVKLRRVVLSCGS